MSPGNTFFLNLFMEQPVIIDNIEHFIRIDYDFDELNKYSNLISMLSFIAEYTSPAYAVRIYKEDLTLIYGSKMKFDENKILTDLKR